MIYTNNMYYRFHYKITGSIDRVAGIHLSVSMVDVDIGPEINWRFDSS